MSAIEEIFRAYDEGYSAVLATGRSLYDLVSDTDGKLRPLKETDPQIVEAAQIFYEKGANPRHVRAALSQALLLRGNLTPDTVLFAAHDLCASTDLVSAIYADLWAIKSCSSRSFLPWAASPSTYPYPTHLHGIVDLKTGNINPVELDARINELRPAANV